MTIRIDYDDQLDTVIEKCNDALAAHSLIFVPDDKEHDGFMLYQLVDLDTPSTAEEDMGAVHQ